MLGASVGSIDGIDVGYTEGTEIWIHDGKVFGITLGTYDGTELGV